MHTKLPRRRRSPGTLATWLVGMKGNPVPLRAGEMMKWQIRERHKVFCSVRDGFYGEMDWLQALLFGQTNPQWQWTSPGWIWLRECIIEPSEVCMECVFLSEVFPPVIPLFPWSGPESFLFASFTVHHPENYFGARGSLCWWVWCFS